MKFVKLKIRGTQTLWTIDRVSLFQPKIKDIKDREIAVPETPEVERMIESTEATTAILGVDIQEPVLQKRKYSRREMTTPVSKMSQSQQRKVKQNLKHVVVEAMKCPPNEVSALAKLLLSPED